MNASTHALPFSSPRPVARRVSAQNRQLAGNTLWVTMGPNPANNVHNFTPDLLAEFNELIDTNLRNRSEASLHDRPAYTVIQSSHPVYFSQGGDLSFFLSCIRKRDAKSLHQYSMTCLDAMFSWNNDFKSDLTTISLVQGRALGGGFELALSSDVLIAEEQSTFGFPEIMFGLFPCTGAMGLLTARVSPFQAERLMTNKKIYTARQLYDMGLVDEVCDNGLGELAVERYIQDHAKRRKSRLKVQQSRHRHSAMRYNEGVQIVDDWVETAMQLTADEIRSMEMLIMMQQGELEQQREQEQRPSLRAA